MSSNREIVAQISLMRATPYSKPPVPEFINLETVA
jgi:hypothetical protein